MTLRIRSGWELTEIAADAEAAGGKTTEGLLENSDQTLNATLFPHQFREPFAVDPLFSVLLAGPRVTEGFGVGRHTDREVRFLELTALPAMLGRLEAFVAVCLCHPRDRRLRYDLAISKLQTTLNIMPVQILRKRPRTLFNLAQRHRDIPPNIYTNVYGISAPHPLIVNVTKQLQRALASSVPGNHRVVAENRGCSLTIGDFGQMAH